MKVSKKTSRGLTLVEILISVTIILILTMAAVPLFAGISDRQILEQNVKRFVIDTRLVRGKALAGAVQEVGAATKKVWWGINLPVCQGGNVTEYELGYVPLDELVDPPVPESGAFTAQVTESIASNLEFDTSNCSVDYPIYFERLTGEVYDIDGPYDVPISEMTVVIKNEDGDTRTVYISSGGTIETR